MTQMVLSGPDSLHALQVEGDYVVQSALPVEGFGLLPTPGLPHENAAPIVASAIKFINAFVCQGSLQATGADG